MRATKNKVLLILGIFLILSVSIGVSMLLPKSNGIASADGINGQATQFDIIDYQGQKVLANYEYMNALTKLLNIMKITYNTTDFMACVLK